MNQTDVTADDVKRLLISSRCPERWEGYQRCAAFANIINNLRLIRSEAIPRIKIGPMVEHNQARTAAHTLGKLLPDLIRERHRAAREVPLLAASYTDPEIWKDQQFAMASHMAMLAHLIDVVFPPESGPISTGPLAGWHMYAFVFYRLLVGAEAEHKPPSKNGPAARFISLALDAAGFSGKDAVSTGAIENAFRRRATDQHDDHI